MGDTIEYNQAKRTEPTPTKGLTAQQFAVLDTLSKAGDRTGFYVRYYEYTGCDQALEQSQISSFSDFLGGVAEQANELVKDHPNYPKDTADKKGVIIFSEEIQKRVFEAVKKSYIENLGGILTDLQMVEIAQQEWAKLGMKGYFPGNAEVVLEKLYEGKVFEIQDIKDLFNKGTAAGIGGMALQMAKDPLGIFSDSALNEMLKAEGYTRHVTPDMQAVYFSDNATGKTMYVSKTGAYSFTNRDGKASYVFSDRVKDIKDVAHLFNVPVENIREFDHRGLGTIYADDTRGKTFVITPDAAGKKLTFTAQEVADVFKTLGIQTDSTASCTVQPEGGVNCDMNPVNANTYNIPRMDIVGGITKEQLTTLKSLADDAEQTSFYTKYYEYTRSYQAITQAKVSSFIDFLNSVPASKNSLVNNYMKGGAEKFSLNVCAAVFKAIEDSYLAGKGGILDDFEIMGILKTEWQKTNSGDYFGQLNLIAKDDSNATAMFYNMLSVGYGAGTGSAAQHAKTNPLQLFGNDVLYNIISNGRYSHDVKRDAKLIYVTDKITGKQVYIHETNVITYNGGYGLEIYILKENDISIDGIAYLFKVCDQEIMQVDKSHYLPSSYHSQQFVINPGAPGSANPRPHLSPMEINQVLEMLQTQSEDIESCSTPDGIMSCKIKAATPVRYYPVAIDLDGNGLEFLGFANSKVKFDVAMDGRLAKIDWINGKDGLLCYDADANGRIDNAREISFYMWDPAAGSDLRALAAVFDTNKDGFLDAQDHNFAQFYIWQDRNQNGIQEDGELFQLADFSIKQIKLHGAIPEPELNASANVLQIADVVYMNNTALPNAYDITLEYTY